MLLLKQCERLFVFYESNWFFAQDELALIAMVFLPAANFSYAGDDRGRFVAQAGE